MKGGKRLRVQALVPQPLMQTHMKSLTQVKQW